MQNLYIRPGELLLPAQDVDPTAWACVACDQYTSQPEYWREADALAGDRPSALRLVLPEVYLSQAKERIPEIHRAMDDYLARGVLTPGVKNGFILTVRSVAGGSRVGLVALLDLEGYDYLPGAKPPVRATEGTILERIPPRLAVRRGAAMELSHVLILIDDPLRTVLEPLYDRRTTLEKLYDFPLMMNGGNLTGYAVNKPEDIRDVLASFAQLRVQSTSSLLYAVGDGNHSLATAKAYWEELKPSLSSTEQADHPARFAMVEVENIHDEALTFEPIHRVLFGYDGETLMEELQRYAARKGWSLAGGSEGQEIIAVFKGKETRLSVTGSPHPLAVGTLQAFLDDWMAAHPEASLDYVHGDSTTRALVTGEKAVAFLLPALPKSELFPMVEKLGALPRKTFSMGEAQEKRYYMEARRLTR